MRPAREFDILIYGATGFTGRLVAEYLATRAGAASGMVWGMAGRRIERLAAVREEIGASRGTPLVVAHAADAASLETMVKRARVIVSTVGPYQLYGNELLAACVGHGVDYVDLCGESAWIRRKIDQHQGAAEASGARLVFSSGFDSCPFDLGVLMLQRECIARYGEPAPRVKGRVRAMQGKPSGGTVASLKVTMAAAANDRQVMADLANPFSLAGGFQGPPQPPANKPGYDERLASWAAPFPMAPVNCKTVHRTNALLGHLYGADFVYDEMVLTGPGADGETLAKAMAAAPLLVGEELKSGEGPTWEERESGFYDLLFWAEFPDGRTVSVSVKGDKDPGYGSTSKIITETALALLETDSPGGATTPAAALGMPLVRRLQEHAGLAFAVES